MILGEARDSSSREVIKRDGNVQISLLSHPIRTMRESRIFFRILFRQDTREKISARR